MPLRHQHRTPTTRHSGLVRGKVARARCGHGLARVLHTLAHDAHHARRPRAKPFFSVRAAVGRALGVGVFDAVDGDPERRAVVGLGRAAGRLLREPRHVAGLVQRGPLHIRILREAVGRDTIQRAVAVREVRLAAT